MLPKSGKSMKCSGVRTRTASSGGRFASATTPGVLVMLSVVMLVLSLRARARTACSGKHSKGGATLRCTASSPAMRATAQRSALRGSPGQLLRAAARACGS